MGIQIRDILNGDRKGQAAEAGLEVESLLTSDPDLVK